jgi:hypothetical protein
VIDTGPVWEEEIFNAGEPLDKDNHLPRDPSTIHNLGEFYQACCQDFGFKTKPEILKELGVNRQEELTDTPELCYLKIASVRLPVPKK